MAKAEIVRTDTELPAGPALDAVRTFLFNCVQGLHKEDQSVWNKLWRHITNMAPGELLVIEIVLPRSGPFHRRHMKIETAVFGAQERFSDREMFRDWLKIGAGHVVWVPGAKGGIVPLPKSVSYKKADQAEFEEYHRKVVAFLRGGHAARFLWRHLGDQADEMMNRILEGFGE